jgi:hypothetical protein
MIQGEMRDSFNKSEENRQELTEVVFPWKEG